MNKISKFVLIIIVSLLKINTNPVQALDSSRNVNNYGQNFTNLAALSYQTKAFGKQNDKVEDNQDSETVTEGENQNPPESTNTEPETPQTEGETAPDQPTVLLSEKGVLEDGDNKISSDNSLYDSYLIRGTEGKSVYISLESTDFDPYLAIIDSEGNILAQHDDINENNKNAAVTITFPKDGEYYLIINSYDPTGRGAYQLTVEKR